MNKRIATKLTMIIVLSLFMASCTDDKMDMANISDQMEAGSTYALPIGTAEADFRSLLEENVRHVDGKFRIETINGELALTYDTAFMIPKSEIVGGLEITKTFKVNYCLYDDLPDGTIIKPMNPYIILQPQNNATVNYDLKLNSITVGTKTVVYNSTYIIKENLSEQSIIPNRGTEESTSSIGEIVGDPTVKDYAINLTLKAKEAGSGITIGDALEGVDKLRINVKCVVPLWFDKESHFTYTDTIKDIEIDDILDNDYVKSATIRIIATNGFPFEGKVRLRMLDYYGNDIAGANGNTPDGSYTYYIRSADVDADGNAIRAAYDTIWINYDENSIADLRKARNMEIKVSTNDLDTHRIKIKETDKAIFKCGIYTIVGINLSTSK